MCQNTAFQPGSQEREPRKIKQWKEMRLKFLVHTKAGNAALEVVHGILEVRRLAHGVENGPLGVRHGKLEAEKQKMEPENPAPDPERQRPGVENPARGVENPMHGVENGKLEADDEPLELENQRLEIGAEARKGRGRPAPRMRPRLPRVL